MTSVWRNLLPVSVPKTGEDRDDDYSVEYSFAVEYSGPPVTGDIPRLIPIDDRRIPTALVANLFGGQLRKSSLPVIQPIERKSARSNKKSPEKGEVSGSDGRFPLTKPREIGNSGKLNSGKSDGYSDRDGALDVAVRVGSESSKLVGAQSSSSSGTLGFSDGHDDSNQVSGSSEVEDLDDDARARASIESSNEEVRSRASSVTGEPNNRVPVVTFRDFPTNESGESDPDELEALPARRPEAAGEMKKGLCNKCNKKNRFAEREVCVVCSAKYCRKCVLRAMGSMPEGRKCITCIGYPIDESNRGSLGRCSRMLKRMLTNDLIKQIMRAETSCEINQLPPHLISVNDKPLSMEELVMLQSCPNPPKKLRPGNYWYDKVSGFWGKVGEKPSQIITAQLSVGYQILRDASNGNTNVLINSREITKPELWMLQAAGIHCEGSPHFWITADGSCQLEGMNYVIGKLWGKKRVRILCAALSLPFPSDIPNPGEGVDKDCNNLNQKNLEQGAMNRFLLVGCDKSGTSTIYKQARVLYGVPFSDEEKQSIKTIIQRNLYRYIAIILEARGYLEEEDQPLEIRRKRIVDPGPSTSGNSDHMIDNKVYTFSPRLEAFASWLLQVMTLGNLEAIFPAATREYSPLVEELWKDKAFQAIYKRRNELNTLPRVANYFLDRAVEISRVEYEPSEMDILYAEGITSANGVASMEFSFPKSSEDGYMESLEQNDRPLRYQLIRVPANSLGENSKWLDMFEDVDLVIYCVSMTIYDEYYQGRNKMMETMKHFESMVAHPSLADKDFLLILNKSDLLEEKLQQNPLTECEWFEDFNPVMSMHPQSSNNSSMSSLSQRAFHYMAVKFKRLFGKLRGQKLYVAMVTGLEGESVDGALRYGREVLKWGDYEGEQYDNDNNNNRNGMNESSSTMESVSMEDPSRSTTCSG
ncbi:extra-large guanine nucleotide-binding protein 1-like [Andrographis paniculata]|uniref:extra-large guanine nucleotide-binding protein 1-like n=1 Tax=Andrographis paniculata TaxID=175694 RepID=UPI0021E83F71|nr:extra-large guanine nucleotide-binding protein 1-like [Andrographis paniculata]XP_051146932.1 extra-large guanine nucleotide-binding protein 1-like [Andrographis paniculata]XP_051146933.1 extra-large guanine nucleotide-binding protein 1-like [Andrographis paniculata]